DGIKRAAAKLWVPPGVKPRLAERGPLVQAGHRCEKALAVSVAEQGSIGCPTVQHHLAVFLQGLLGLDEQHEQAWQGLAELIVDGHAPEQRTYLSALGNRQQHATAGRGQRFRQRNASRRFPDSPLARDEQELSINGQHRELLRTGTR